MLSALGRNIDCTLDIVLPDMAAVDVYGGLREAYSGLTTLVSTGSDTEDPAREIREAEAQCFIQKPYTLDALSEKLKELLG